MAGIAETLDSAPEPARLRTGRVTKLLGASQVVVDIGRSELVDMPCLTQYEPILGDIVQIIQQGSVQVVLGRTSPIAGDNVLTNPSFELDSPGSPPSYWTPVISGASSNVKVDLASGWGSITGTKWLEINQQGAGESVVYVVSEAIPVLPGELWTAAGWVVNSPLTLDGGFSEIYLSWYKDPTSMYPSTAVGDTVMQGVVFPPGGTCSWFLLRQLIGEGAVVPDGVAYMRVVLVSYLADDLGASAYWDGIVCRKLRGV
ncbi:hypothetical protein [Dactylosporangium fulvum]|uniref:Minor tail protein n=1 Tax=Dactylosporangium fulvum TaxID=53359 RepID=A0ABY5W8Q6_9ACTN|nr:hypothetical protein [Dactylosporangium fulvum]UWP85869.1 hypothetical protein Dfulv_17120 [Dactylosporangium fulvum]